MKSKLLAVAATVAVAWCQAAIADVVTLQAQIDNTLYEDPQGLSSNGVGMYMFVGKTNSGQIRRGVIKFDLSAIPPGSTINSATLRMTMSRTTAGSQPVRLHRAGASWGEGYSDAAFNEGGGGLATPNDATWIHRFYSTIPWAAPGGDYAPASSASTTVGGDGQYTWTGAGVLGDVSTWVNNPSANHGWVVVGNESASRTSKRFNSSEHETSGTRPQLVIDYVPSGAIGACCLAGNVCQVMTQAVCVSQGGTYQGDGTNCSPGPCGTPFGACCTPAGLCTQLTQAQCASQGGTYRGDGTTCTPNPCTVQLTPFVDALTIPPVAQPVIGTPGGAATYEMSIQRVRRQLHRDLPPTLLYAYNGEFPGPTIEARSNQTVFVRWANDLRDDQGQLLTQHDLPVDTCLHGPDTAGAAPRTVTHLHGGRMGPESDGHPDFTQLPGQTSITYTYPNKQIAATLWYHDHALGITRLNVAMGLAGFYLLRDSTDESYGLPNGSYDVPLMITDRSFGSDGGFRYNQPPGADQVFGDTMLVNGKVWPYMTVKRGMYRFRMVNACTSRTLTLALSNGASIIQIGGDGGLLPAPVTLPSVTLSPGERIEVCIDFTPLSPGTNVVLTNSAPAPYPGPAGQGVIPNVMQFRVIAELGGGGFVPPTLRPITPLNEATAFQFRDMYLQRFQHPCMGFIWLINGLMWDDITEYPQFGTTEVWSFINDSGVAHPMHLHLVHFQVLDRQDFVMQGGQPVPTGSPVPRPATEAGWKDTVVAMPGQITRVIARFDGSGGTYPYHCHLLEHEDHEMMRQFTVECMNDITSQPRDAANAAGGNQQFFCTGVGSGTIRYQWFHDGQPLTNGPTGWGSTITGATAGVLTVSNLHAPDAGAYSCVVRDDCGPITSRNALLTLSPTCNPDFNQDGVADQDDVAYLINVIAGGPNPTGENPDFNNDGIADQDDLAALINVVAGGGCP